MSENLSMPGAQLPQIGETVDHFELTELIGEGGVGRVYRAKDLSLGRDVALKFLYLRDLSAPADEINIVKERFVREARLMARVSHPNIVQIYEAVLNDQSPFIAMELVPGITLAKRIEDPTPISYSETCHIARQVVQALRFAWDRFQIVHRDLKPANIMLSSGGHIKLLDMGLAKVMDDSESTREFRTRVGVVAGTPLYMAPEQHLGVQDLDNRIDIFALGALLCRLFTFRNPYPSNNIVALLDAKLSGLSFRIEEYAKGLPDELVKMVYSMLEPQRENRIADYTEIEAILGRAEKDLKDTAPPPAPSPESMPESTALLGNPQPAPAQPVPPPKAQPLPAQAAPAQPPNAQPVPPPKAQPLPAQAAPAQPPKAQPAEPAKAAPRLRLVKTPDEKEKEVISTNTSKLRLVRQGPAAVEAQKNAAPPPAARAVPAQSAPTWAQPAVPATPVPPAQPAQPAVPATPVPPAQAAQPPPPTPQPMPAQAAPAQPPPPPQQAMPAQAAPAPAMPPSIQQLFTGPDAMPTLNPHFAEAMAHITPGTKLASYTIGPVMGRGPFTVTFRGTDSSTQRGVAIKFIDLPATQEAKQRFEDLAGRLCQQQHDSVCGTIGYQCNPPYAILITELVSMPNSSSMTLHGYRQKYGGPDGMIPERQVLKVAYQVTTAVQQAHSLGLTHGGLKPDNILFELEHTEGDDWRLRMKMTDFGVISMVGHQPFQRWLQTALDSEKQLPWSIAESIVYLAPEVWDGAPADPNADLFSIGALVHYFLTGYNDLAPRQKPSAYRSGLNPAWDPVLGKLLRSDPSRRFSSAQELAEIFNAIEM